MANINYSNQERSLVKDPGLVVGFVNRIPDSLELVSDKITNDPLISVKTKECYWKMDGDSKVSSDVIIQLGINNKWVNLNSDTLG